MTMTTRGESIVLFFSACLQRTNCETFYKLITVFGATFLLYVYRDFGQCHKMPVSGTMVGLLERKTKSEVSEASTAEFVQLGNKQKLVPGDLVLYRPDKKVEFTPSYGTVVYKPKETKIPKQVETEINVENEITKELTPLVAQPTSTDQLESTLADQLKSADTKLAEEEEDDGLVHVRWANRSEPINASKLCLVDRMIERGQTVRDKSGVFGVVTGGEVRAAVQILSPNTNHVIKDIPVNKLKPMTPWVRGQHVVYQNWVGVIIAVHRRLFFRMDGGMVFSLRSVENDGFEKTDIYHVSEKTCPGTRVRIPYSVLRRAKWAPPAMNFLTKWFPPLPFLYSFSTVTVDGSHVEAISVDWLCSLNAASGTQNEAPETELALTPTMEINAIGAPSWELVRLNSVRVHSIHPNDSVTSFSNWFNDFQTQFLGELKFDDPTPAPDDSANQIDSHSEVQVPVKVILCQSYVEVKWENNDTKELILGTKVHEIVGNEDDTNVAFAPGVILANVLLPHTEKYGVVQPGSGRFAGEKMILVKWINAESEELPVTKELEISQESIFNVKPHSKYALFQRGTIVMFTNPIDEQIGGTVVDIDVLACQMIVGSPMKTNCVNVWPHCITPISKRCTWNFFSRQWLKQDLLSPAVLLGVPAQQIYPDRRGIVLDISHENALKTVRNWAPDLPAFKILDSVPKDHKFFTTVPEFVDNVMRAAINEELSHMQDNVPTGVWIRAYENRMDLISILLLGDIQTPYEDGLFMFDIQLQHDFPKNIPRISFVPYSNRLSPFTDMDGAFCTSKLTWNFQDRPPSYILNLCQQLQKLLFHVEPFYADTRHEKLVGTEESKELSRDYNERVYIEVLTSFCNMALKPHDPWEAHIVGHLENIFPYKIREVKEWLRLSEIPTSDDLDPTEQEVDDADKIAPPRYPLLPLSKGFGVAFTSRYEKMQLFFRDAVEGATSVEESYVNNDFEEVCESVDESSISTSVNDEGSVEEKPINEFPVVAVEAD